jgi:hypothetical protein
MKTVKNTIMLIMIMGLSIASDQRVAAMGGNVGFLPDDDQSFTMFPAAINDLDYIQVTGAGTGNGNVGIVWGEETTFGFMFNGMDPSNNDMVNLAWGNGTLGAVIGVGMSANKVGEGNETSTTDFNASVGTNMSFGELGAHLMFSSSSDGDDDTDDLGGLGLGLALRRDQNVWLFSKMLVNFAYGSYSSGDSFSLDMMDLELNLFTPIEISDDVNAVFALGFGFVNNSTSMEMTVLDSSWTLESSETVISLPASTVAVEANVTDWAAVRFGMNHSYVISGTSSAEDGVETTWRGTSDSMGESNFSWNFGLGFDYGSFLLDMVVSEDLFTNPVHYVTGRNETPLTTTASITWKF